MADVIIVYDSNTGNTAKAAAEIFNGVQDSGAEVEMKKVEETTVEDLKKAKAVILGSPCINDNYSNLMREFVDTKFRDAKPSDKIGAVFGTYKWNGGNVHQLENDLRWLGVRLVAEGVNAHKHADSEIVKKLRALGRKVGEEAKKL